MQVELNYGRRSLPVELPGDLQVTVVRKPVMPVLTDPVAAVRRAFQDPVGSTSLDNLARAARSATIAICDITRPVPNHLFLRPLIETLLRAGIPATDIRVLVATGLHRPNLGAELDELIGDPWVLRTVRVENHYATRDEDHLLLGSTSTRRTVVRLDRRFVEADLKIVTGLVEAVGFVRKYAEVPVKRRFKTVVRDSMTVDKPGSPADILQIPATVSKIVAEAKGGGMV
jgi:lactate racemase